MTLIGAPSRCRAGHLARAALESIAYQVADLLDAMRADSRGSLHELRVDGGASSNALLLQFAALLVNGFSIENFGWAIAGSMVISVISWVLSSLFNN